MRKVLTFLAVTTLAAGCAEETTYQGKTAAQWVHVLRDKDEIFRRQAVVALGELGRDAATAGPALRRVAEDRQANGRETRQKAIVAWWGVSKDPEHEVLPRLSQWLRDPDDGDAQLAAEAIARIGPPAAGALPDLRWRYEEAGHRIAGPPDAAGVTPAGLRKAILDAIRAVTKQG